MAYLYCTRSVVLPIRPAGLRILGVLEQIARTSAVDLTITCGTEGHRTGAHPRGEALDVRSKDLNPGHVADVYRALQFLLGKDFTVLYELPIGATPRHGSLVPIVYRSPGASAEHFHIQLRKDLAGQWPYPLPSSPDTIPV